MRRRGISGLRAPQWSYRSGLHRSAVLARLRCNPAFLHESGHYYYPMSDKTIQYRRPHSAPSCNLGAAHLTGEIRQPPNRRRHRESTVRIRFAITAVAEKPT